jgi:hypothetical protein
MGVRETAGIQHTRALATGGDTWRSNADRRTTLLSGRVAVAFCVAIAIVASSPSLTWAANPAGNSIATATPLIFGDLQSGGGQGTDFWKVALQGGDRVIIDATFPPITLYNDYQMDLFDPSVTDFTYFQSSPVVQREYLRGQTQITIQAPRPGNYTLAVCEGPESSCSDSDQFSINAVSRLPEIS